MIGDSRDSPSTAYSLFKGSSYMWVAISTVELAGFLFRVVTAREFGPTEYGYLSLGLVVVGIGSTVVLTGQQSAVRRYLPEYLDNGEYQNMSGILIFVVGVVGSLGVLAALLVSVWAEEIATLVFGNPQVSTLVVIFAIGIPLAAFQKLSENALLGVKRFRATALVRILGRGGVLNFVLAWGVLALGATLLHVSIIYVATTALAMTLAVSLFLQGGRNYAYYPSFEMKRWSAFALPLFVSSSIGLILSWADTLMLSLFQSAAAVGLYNSGYPFGMMIAAVVPMFGSVFVPLGTELMNQERLSELSDIFEKVRYVLFLLTLPAVLFIIPNSGILLTVIFGEQYTSAAPVFLIIALSNFVVILTGPSTALLQIFEDNLYLLSINVAGAVLNILLNLLLIPTYSIIGAAISYGLAIALINVLMYRRGIRRLGASGYSGTYFQPFLVAAFCSGVTSVILHRIDFTLLSTIGLAITTFLGYLAILQLFDVVDIAELLDL